MTALRCTLATLALLCLTAISASAGDAWDRMYGRFPVTPGPERAPAWELSRHLDLMLAWNPDRQNSGNRGQGYGAGNQDSARGLRSNRGRNQNGNPAMQNPSYGGNPGIDLPQPGHRRQGDRNAPWQGGNPGYRDNGRGGGNRGYYNDGRGGYHNDGRGYYNDGRGGYHNDGRGYYNDGRGGYHDGRGNYNDGRGGSYGGQGGGGDYRRQPSRPGSDGGGERSRPRSGNPGFSY